MLAGFHDHGGGAEDGLGGEAHGIGPRKAVADTAIGEGVDDHVDISGASAGEAGDGIHETLRDFDREADSGEERLGGGGVVFGPKPRDYSKKVSKSVKRLALRKAFSARIIAGDVLTVDSFAVKEPKTKQFVSLLKDQTEETKVLVIAAAFDEQTYKAARNVKPALLITADDVNTEHLLAYKKIIVTSDALGKLAERTSNK